MSTPRKPCPFCGNTNINPPEMVEEGEDYGKVYAVKCWECDARGPERFSANHAIRGWNNLRLRSRALREEMGALREELSALVEAVETDARGFGMTLGPNTETVLLDARAAILAAERATPEAPVGEEASPANG